MEQIFWISAFFIVYSYAIYPILLKVAASAFGKQVLSYELEKIEEWPEVAVVIAAYNEEKNIRARIENLFAQDYPAEKITFLIGSDGSKDKTNEILSSFNDPRLTIQLFETNRGKASVLNNLMQRVTQPITIFSDANTYFETDAIKRLVVHFQEHNVGAVCGELNLFNPADSDNNKDSIYWRYEQFLKDQESKLDALLGANGAIYAIRSELYQKIPSNTVVDDFQIVMNVAKTNHRIIYDKSALAHEEIAPTLAEESKRRIRIGMGNYQAFTRLYWTLNPLIGWRFFSYVSHKVLRWFTPHLMLLVLISNCLLLGKSFYNACLILQITFYSLAFWGKYQSDQGKSLSSIHAFITFFVSMNFSLLQGFKRFLFNNVQGTWQRTSR